MFDDHCPQFVSERQYRKDAHAATIPGVVALLAPLAFIKNGLWRKTETRQKEWVGLVLLLAILTHHAHETLRDHAIERIGEDRARYAQLKQAGNRADGIVCMNGRTDNAADKRAAYGILRGMRITNLTDHEHIRILAQDRAHRTFISKIAFGMYFALTHPVEMEFDRVFKGDDIFFFTAQFLQHRI